MQQTIKDKIESIIRNSNADEREIIFQLKKLLYEDEIQNVVEKDSKSITELISENINQMRVPTKSNKIATSFIELDKDFGFALGEFIVIGGRPAMGKTQLLVNLALNISTTAPVLYYTFDLSASLLTNRFISTLSGKPISSILDDEVSNEMLDVLNAKVEKHQLFINDSFNQSMPAFKAHCQKMIEEKGVKVIFVDYLQLMGSYKYNKYRESEIAYICRELKSIAKDFNVCVIATSQLSRAVESRGGDKIPVLSDLRDSGAIEQDADKVIFIYRPEYYGITEDRDGNSTAGLTELIIAKNRNGKIGTTNILRDANFTSFRDFDHYKEDFSFSKERLDEMTAQNPATKYLIDKFDNFDIF